MGGGFVRRVVDDPRLIYKCCKLYYEENRGQQEIADLLGISRVSVSRLLSAGRESGIVQIQIVSPNHLTYSKLEQELEQVYGLKEAVVVENSPLSTTYDHISTLSTETLSLLETYLHDQDVVGVSMGMSLHNICHGTRKNTNNINCMFVPMVGGISTGRDQTVNIHSNQIAQNFAQLFGGRYIDFFAPAIFTDPAVLEGFMKEAPMQHVLQYYKEIKTAIMGIGIPNRAGSTMIRAGYITQEMMDELVERGAVGDISLQFFDRNGEFEQFRAFNSRVAGMSLTQLRGVENKIGISSGVQKAEAIYGALRGGFVNILITDQECALKLLEMGKQEDAR